METKKKAELVGLVALAGYIIESVRELLSVDGVRVVTPNANFELNHEYRGAVSIKWQGVDARMCLAADPDEAVEILNRLRRMIECLQAWERHNEDSSDSSKTDE